MIFSFLLKNYTLKNVLDVMFQASNFEFNLTFWSGQIDPKCELFDNTYFKISKLVAKFAMHTGSECYICIIFHFWPLQPSPSKVMSSFFAAIEVFYCKDHNTKVWYTTHAFMLNI